MPDGWWTVAISSTEAARLAQLLLRALDRPSILCGSLTLNFNDGEFCTYDVKEHCRAPKDLTPIKAAPRHLEIEGWPHGGLMK